MDSSQNLEKFNVQKVYTEEKAAYRSVKIYEKIVVSRKKEFPTFCTLNILTQCTAMIRDILNGKPVFANRINENYAL